MILLKPVVALLRGLVALAFATMLVVLALAVLPYFDGASSYSWIRRLVAWDTAAMAQLRDWVPTRLGQLDFARPFLALAFFLVAATLDAVANRLSGLSAASAKKRSLSRYRPKSRKKSKKESKQAPTPAAAPEGSASDKKSREELVRLMVEAKRELDAMSKDVAFLALDVVESTNMKLGEDPAFVEHDFREFKTMVEAETFRGLLKSAWTPDGAMLCYDSLERAVRAAQAMLRQLPVFNSDSRMMATPFRVRCGINAGRVPYDPDTPMEAMSHNAIDVAGHMQKYAEPDSIYVAGDLIRKHGAKWGFEETEAEVDGYDVHIWRGPSADRSRVAS